MGKEETIGLIRPGHTSPAEINQKSLHYGAPARLTLVLPTQLSAGEPQRARSLPTPFPPAPGFQPGRSSGAEGEPAALWHAGPLGTSRWEFFSRKLNLFFFFPMVYEPSYRISELFLPENSA